MSSIRSRISTAIQRTMIGDVLVRAAERWCGVRYPDALIGRRNIPLRGGSKGVVLVVAAHPDDEVLGAGTTLIEQKSAGARVVVVFTTNGAGGNWRAGLRDRGQLSRRRFAEACDALGVIGIPSDDIVCLGFPDGGLHRYLREAARDIMYILRQCAPSVVYVHALEGGHCDHDMTSYLLQELCAKIKFKNLYEWCQYNLDARFDQFSGEALFAYDPFLTDFQLQVPQSVDKHRETRHEMLEKYISQSDVIGKYPFRNEGLRKAIPQSLLPRLQYFSGFSASRLARLSRRMSRERLIASPSR